MVTLLSDSAEARGAVADTRQTGSRRSAARPAPRLNALSRQAAPLDESE